MDRIYLGTKLLDKKRGGEYKVTDIVHNLCDDRRILLVECVFGTYIGDTFHIIVDDLIDSRLEILK